MDLIVYISGQWPLRSQWSVRDFQYPGNRMGVHFKYSITFYSGIQYVNKLVDKKTKLPVERDRGCLVPKIILQYPSHQIFRHMHETLNVVEKIINYTV